MDNEQRDSALAWERSAQAYIATQDAGNVNRTVLLDPVMIQQCGDVHGRRALDLGCGEGRFARMLAERGADAVGIDITATLLETAQARGAAQPCGARQQYGRAAAEQLPFAAAAFDLVVSYVTLVDIVDYRSAIAECGRVSCDKADHWWSRTSASSPPPEAGTATTRATACTTASTGTPTSGRKPPNGQASG
jgi:ubiquinone/menaquinone biosynthesis C-methylase UbiE